MAPVSPRSWVTEGRLTWPVPAAWPSGLGKGLQSPVHRFDSGRRLHQVLPGHVRCTALWLARLTAIPRLSRGSDLPLRGVAELATTDASRLADLPQLADGLPNRITIAGVLVRLTQAAALQRRDDVRAIARPPRVPRRRHDEDFRIAAVSRDRVMVRWISDGLRRTPARPAAERRRGRRRPSRGAGRPCP